MRYVFTARKHTATVRVGLERWRLRLSGSVYAGRMNTEKRGLKARLEIRDRTSALEKHGLEMLDDLEIRIVGIRLRNGSGPEQNCSDDRLAFRECEPQPVSCFQTEWG